MIQSMTGFGKASVQLPTKKITVEIKSLNSKGFDLNMRLPSVYREMELGLRNQAAHILERGKVDYSVFIESTSEVTSTKVNAPIIRAYMDQLEAISPSSDHTELMKMAIRMPDALKTERDEIDENDWQEIQQQINEALTNIKDFRIAEGASLEREFVMRIENIRSLMNSAVALDSERIETVKIRLRTAIEDLKALLTKIDTSRN